MSIEGLSYEQLQLLRILRETPDQEGFALTRLADCSFEEFSALADRRLVDPGAERIEPKTLHPILTDAGRAALAEAESAGIFTPA